MKIETYHNFSDVPQLWIDEYISYTQQEFYNGCLSMAMVRKSPNGKEGYAVTFLKRSFTAFEFSELARTCDGFTLIAELPDGEIEDGCRCLSNTDISDEELDFRIANSWAKLKLRRAVN